MRRVHPVNPERGPLVQPADHTVSQGSSPASLVELGTAKSYDLACVLPWNLIFVDSAYRGRLNLGDNSLQTLRRDMSSVTWLFSGYDGTVILDGHRALPWHGTPIKVWQLPRPLRRYPDDYTSVQHTMLRLCQ